MFRSAFVCAVSLALRTILQFGNEKDFVCFLENAYVAFFKTFIAKIWPWWLPDTLRTWKTWKNRNDRIEFLEQNSPCHSRLCQVLWAIENHVVILDHQMDWLFSHWSVPFLFRWNNRFCFPSFYYFAWIFFLAYLACVGSTPVSLSTNRLSSSLSIADGSSSVIVCCVSDNGWRCSLISNENKGSSSWWCCWWAIDAGESFLSKCMLSIRDFLFLLYLSQRISYEWVYLEFKGILGITMSTKDMRRIMHVISTWVMFLENKCKKRENEREGERTETLQCTQPRQTRGDNETTHDWP